jgi:exodeoxyribonuclease V beta subunit
MTHEFDLFGPLPKGTTVLEASAGTGKTFTIAALVTRYVVEGRARLPEMLIITFGRAATEELRERVRSQLREAELALANPSGIGGNEFLRRLVDVSDAELEDRRKRVAEAMAEFDSATIATTHTFCQTVLRSLGVAGDTDRNATLVEDLSELTDEVINDLYLASFVGEEKPILSVSDARKLGRRVINDPQAELVISKSTPESEERLRFAEAVRVEVERRKRRLGILSFDDLLSQLAHALADEDRPAAERMRQRWQVVLVDEFQDTDPVQWNVLERAFHGHCTLVLIGDPKQAIYAFRGGDIYTYLRARGVADEVATLNTNWRSDAPLVQRLDVLLSGAALGDAQIVVHEVTADHQGNRLIGAPRPAPFRMRYLPHQGEEMRIADARQRIAADLAADVAELLAANPEYDDPDEGKRPLRASDIAVLSFSQKEAPLYREALAEHGIASVVRGGQSVLNSRAGEEWLFLLEAIERPQMTRRVRAAAITDLLGRTPQELVDGGDDLTDELAEQCRQWQDLIRNRGVAAVFEALATQNLAARVLSQPDGERLHTDLVHMAQILHEVWQDQRLGVVGLLQWLRHERTTAAGDLERTRRLDTDQDAVQFVTIHGSKGLQYPIVYLPHAFNNWVSDRETEHLFHDPATGERCLDITGVKRVQQSVLEQAGETLRLDYVALTRARSTVVAWYARTRDSKNGGLTRLIVDRAPGQAEVSTSVAVPQTDAEALLELRKWEDAGAFEVEEVGARTAPVVPPPLLPSGLTVREWNRRVDTAWRRTSYSGLIRAEEQAPISEPEDLGTVDEDTLPAEAMEVEIEKPDVVDLPSPMNDLPAGAAFGSLVHGVLEHADPDAPDLLVELRHWVDDQQRWWAINADNAELAEGLVPMQHTPMGPLVDNACLKEIPLRDRLRELDFEIPLSGGDAPTGATILLKQIGDVIRKHLAESDPMRAYADKLDNPSLGEQVLRGYLSGSIDVVLRVGAEPRYVVVDYKTNRLGEPGQPGTALDYTQEHLTAAMVHSNYPLQALLYSVVLHRYLRWRQPGYDPETHLGGIIYLYVRGMCGPETPVVEGIPCGCFTWKPPAGMIVELSDLLAGMEVAP